MSLPISILSISRRHVFAAVGTYRNYSSDINVIRNPELPALRRGTGGRSSFNGNVVTVFGATGFIGRYIVNELGKTGTQVIIPYRSEPDDYQVKKLKLCGDLGQILYQPFHLKDPASIRKSIKYSNVVINLIGSHFETRNFKFDDVHVKGAREIARACKELNVDHLIHFSTLNVRPEEEDPYLLGFPIRYRFFSSKLKGEQAVFEEFPDATIIRPAMIFGRFDRFLWAMNSRYRKSGESIPLWAAGEKTVKQPVYINDIVNGVMSAMRNVNTKGKIYQAVGPKQYLLSEIADYCGRVANRCEVDFHHDARFDPFIMLKILWFRYFVSFAWHNPRLELCFEQLMMEYISDEIDRNLPNLEDLGVILTKFEAKAENVVRGKYLNKGDHFKDLLKYEPIRPPPVHNTYF